MEELNQNINPQILPENKEELGLPKSTLINFIRDVLISKKVKCDRAIYQLMDKISTRYVNYVSTLGSENCLKKGKKTLNVEHVLEALKSMNFQKHINLITQEIDITEIQKEEPEKDTKEVKQLINRKRKKSSRNKKWEGKDLEDLAKKQKELFENARKEQLSLNMNMFGSAYNNQNNINPENKNNFTNMKSREDLEKEMFENEENNSQDVNFDL